MSYIFFDVINVPIDLFCAGAINVKSLLCSERTMHLLY